MIKKKKKSRINKNNCPSCNEPCLNAKDLDRHCRNIHGKSYEELLKIRSESQLAIENWTNGDENNEK